MLMNTIWEAQVFDNIWFDICVSINLCSGLIPASWLVIGSTSFELY